MNFNNYLFRCSSLPHLMTNGRKKDEVLSETAKAYLRELWIKEVYHREKIELSNKFCTKGTMVESDSLELFSKVTKTTYFKNQKEFSNDFIKGTPDVVGGRKIIDIKSSWDIWTFASVNEAQAIKNYFYQLHGYMWLTGKKKADLVYCLVNTPEVIYNNELYKISFLPIDKTEEEIKPNYIFDDIPASKRVKKFSFDYDPEVTSKVIEKIVAAREYMKGLSL